MNPGFIILLIGRKKKCNYRTFHPIPSNQIHHTHHPLQSKTTTLTPSNPPHPHPKPPIHSPPIKSTTLTSSPPTLHPLRHIQEGVLGETSVSPLTIVSPLKLNIPICIGFLNTEMSFFNLK